MPEVAEVRLLADTMERFLLNKRLVQLRVRNPDALAKWVNRCCPFLQEFNAKLDSLQLTGSSPSVKSVHTHGKLSWLECDGDIFIGIHFGMSGNIRPEPTSDFLATYRWKGRPVSVDEYLKHCLVVIEYVSEDGGPIGKLYFHDIRRFGRIEIFWSRAELDLKLSKLGHDPLSHNPYVTNDEIVRLFRLHNHKNVCKALMDQTLLAGVGNYLKSESLYRAKISPHATIHMIPDDALCALYRAVRAICHDAYTAGGAALYTYSGVQGDQSDFKKTLRVYGKEGQSCDGYTVQRIADKQSPDRRTTFWIPEIQTIGGEQVQAMLTPPLPKPTLPPPKVWRR